MLFPANLLTGTEKTATGNKYRREVWTSDFYPRDASERRY